MSGPEILFEDKHLLIVNKPAGLLVQADKTGDPDLLHIARDYIRTRYHRPGNVYLGLVHRIDRPASGVLVLARTSKAAARLSEQFRAGSVEKRYLAVVAGRCAGQGTCHHHLIKKDRTVQIVDAGYPGARFAELRWEAQATGTEASLVQVELLTGRPHQIRVQLASLGFPLLGDFRYGARRVFDGRNLALHAFFLGLEHPVTHERQSWTAPPPASWDGYFPDTIREILAGAVQGA